MLLVSVLVFLLVVVMIVYNDSVRVTLSVFLFVCVLQEVIKITKVIVFVNPYDEVDTTVSKRFCFVVSLVIGATSFLLLLLCKSILLLLLLLLLLLFAAKGRAGKERRGTKKRGQNLSLFNATS